MFISLYLGWFNTRNVKNKNTPFPLVTWIYLDFPSVFFATFSSWWFQPIWKILVNWMISPSFGLKITRMFELPPPSFWMSGQKTQCFCFIPQHFSWNWIHLTWICLGSIECFFSPSVASWTYKNQPHGYTFQTTKKLRIELTKYDLLSRMERKLFNRKYEDLIIDFTGIIQVR